MPETAEDIVLRHNWERMHRRLIDEHPDELIREIALEVLKGTYTWTEAAASPTYGAAIETMHVGMPGEEPEETPEGDWLTVLEARHRRRVEAVEERGEIALSDPDLND